MDSVQNAYQVDIDCCPLRLGRLVLVQILGLIELGPKFLHTRVGNNLIYSSMWTKLCSSSKQINLGLPVCNITADELM